MSNLGNKATMARMIRYYMDLNGKTRNDLCEALGVKYTTLTDWIKGNTYPRIDKIELMANYFGVKKSALIEGISFEEFHLNDTEKAIIRRYRTASFDIRCSVCRVLGVPEEPFQKELSEKADA